MVLHVIETEKATGFEHGPGEDVYRVAEPRFRVSARAGVPTLPASGWIELIRRLRAADATT